MPSEIVKVAHKALKELRINGRICELTRAKKSFKCSWSGLYIEPGEEYYAVTLAGAGLGSTKFPDRVKVEYIDEYLNRNFKKKEETCQSKA